VDDTAHEHRALWLTLRGASGAVPILWLAWCAALTFVAPTFVDPLGPAGVAVLGLAGGWAFARWLPVPVEWLRRYHLDDQEVTAMGPGRRVRRLPWAIVSGITQDRRALRLEGDDVAIRLPLRGLVAAGAWGVVLARVVPQLAEEMWSLLEEGEQVRLAPAVEPSTRALAWWAWVPLAAAFVAAPGMTGPKVALGLAVAERLVAFLRTRIRAVALHRAGAAVRSRLWRLVVAWPRLEVERTPNGLLLGVQGRPYALVASGLPNFWAAAPVIEMKAHLGARAGATVHFRVRLAEDGPAVVGEVESSG
jgi:hypothetical protein